MESEAAAESSSACIDRERPLEETGRLISPEGIPHRNPETARLAGRLFCRTAALAFCTSLANFR